MPTVLRELMRHASINTTMAYYVGTNAEATADALWAAVGTSLGYHPNQRNIAHGSQKTLRNKANVKYRRRDLNPHDLAVTGF